jgi:GH18 family chitinase
MAYDDGYGQVPGINHSSYRYARSAMDYWLVQRRAPPAKAILGVPFYGRSLTDRHSISYYRLRKADGRASASDSSGGFGYNGYDTLRAKAVNQARARGGGIMVWQLNQDANGADSLLNAIFDAVKEPAEAADPPVPGDGQGKMSL